EHFVNLFETHPFIEIQREVGSSSWFGFSMVLSEKSPLSRKELVSILQSASIECRPIVTGNFVKNKSVLQYFDYEVSGSLYNAQYIDDNGLFVGNHQVDIRSQIDLLGSVLSPENLRGGCRQL
ncbi:MAG: hypothetical protein RLO12_21100, partial [Fulvivirga sp.]